MIDFITLVLGQTIIKGGEHVMYKFQEMNIASHILSLVVAIVGFAVGDFTKSMQLLIMLQVIDIITGFKKGKDQNVISSVRLKEGAASKFGAWLYIIIGHAIDMMSTSGSIAVARTLVVSYLTIMELTSIAENAEEISKIKPPSFISRYLEVTRTTIDHSSVNEMGEIVNPFDSKNGTRKVVRKRKRKSTTSL